MVSEFADADLSGRVVLDKHPEMIRYLPLLARVFPDAEVIVVHRDIRDVALSCYMLPVPLGPVSVDYLEIDTILIHSMRETTSEKLARPILAVRYERFVTEPAAGLEHLIGTLGWPRKTEAEPVPVDPSHPRSPSYAAVAAPTHSSRIGRWRHYEALAQRDLAGDE